MNTIGLALRMLRRVPDFWIETRNVYKQAELSLPDNTVFYRGNSWIYTPDDLLVYRVWANHCRAYYIRWEIEEFLNLARGCSRLLDVGASAGIYSAIFWDSRSANPVVHSIEPDRKSFELLKETRRLNSTKRTDGEWHVADCALGGGNSTQDFCSSGFGAEATTGKATKKSIFDGSQDRIEQFAVTVKTLETYCAEATFVPEMIKMDIESFEYETILASRDFLSEHRCNLFLELHNEKLKCRNKEPREIVEFLSRLGYKVKNTRDRQHPFDSPVVHLSFEMP